jgi:hypothetical protein
MQPRTSSITTCFVVCLRRPNKNPAWYLAPGKDPLLDIYRAYDDIVSDMLALPGSPRLMLATGLHQDPIQPSFTIGWSTMHHS